MGFDITKYVTYDEKGKAKFRIPTRVRASSDYIVIKNRKTKIQKLKKRLEKEALDGVLKKLYDETVYNQETGEFELKSESNLDSKYVVPIKLKAGKYKNSSKSKIERLITENKSKVEGALDKNLPAYKYIVVNKNDRNLKPFVIWMPKPPKRNKIPNYNKPIQEQIFRYTEIPQRLLDVEEKIRIKLEDISSANKNKTFTKQKLIVGIWDYLMSNAKEYKEELKFIIDEHYKLTYGAWYFIKGRPIYIDSWHYRYLNYWTLGGGIRPEFRMRDWEYFHLHKYAYTTTEDADGKDLFTRTILGVAYPKHRRDGATHKSLCILYSIMVSAGERREGGIQSFDNDNAFEHYSGKLLPAFDSMPFYVKPLWTGSDMPINRLSFSKPQGISGIKSLNSKITFATTSESKYYDGHQLDVILTDETGKTKAVDILARHEIVVQTSALGGRANIFGFMMYPTTVEDIEEGSGKPFYKLCSQSQFHNRDASGQTTSGLITYFKSAVHGLEGFVDIFGDDIIDDPTKDDLWRIKFPKKDSKGKYLGSRRFLLDKRESAKTDINSYNNIVRLFPIEYIECFGAVYGDVGFDTEKLKKRRDDILTKEHHGDVMTRTGYFVWVINGERVTAKDFITMGYHKISGITDTSTVEWVDDKDGRYTCSYLPKINNQRYKKDNRWYPKNPDEFTHCADPFKYLKDNEAKNIYRTDKGKLSKGGLATFWELDTKIDPIDKDVRSWQSNRFVLSYLYRPSTLDEYCEEAIMQVVYFGGMMFPETNVPDLWRYFVDRGFEGYLLYMTDPSSKNKYKTYPGFNSGTESKQTLFSLARTYISNHIEREEHIDIIREFLDIKGLEDMTNHDLFVAATGCLYGSNSRMRLLMNVEKEYEEDIFEEIWKSW